MRLGVAFFSSQQKWFKRFRGKALGPKQLDVVNEAKRKHTSTSSATAEARNSSYSISEAWNAEDFARCYSEFRQ